MKIVAVHCYSYRLPFRVPFTTAHGEMTAREGIIVELTTESGLTGVGEIAPLPVGTRFSPSASWVMNPLPHGRGRAEARPYRTWHSSMLAPSIRCGLEIALLDALGKEEGRTVAALLAPVGTPPRDMISVNAVIGAKTTEDATIAARKAIQQGYRCIKLKVAVGGTIEEEVERIAAVRAAIGPAMHLRLDANEGWHLHQAIAILSQCLPYKIQYVEQPLPAHDLMGMYTLRRAVSIPIAVDEALNGIESARRILESEAADIFIIKPQLAGGLRASQQMMAEAAERGVRSVITSTLEAGIGVAAALHLAAASPSVTLECGLATLPLLEDDLLLSPLSVHDGFLTVPTGPGLGVALDREALSRYTIERF